ncbi:MAG TPA: hypothetical protein VHV08_11805 [Pirellulales bacterium]|nr:hypothetical protein [Pirellulales bacterium]
MPETKKPWLLAPPLIVPAKLKLLPTALAPPELLWLDEAAYWLLEVVPWNEAVLVPLTLALVVTLLCELC